MATPSQQRITQLRDQILLDVSTTNLTVFLQKHRSELMELGKAIQLWMDETSLQYKQSGFSKFEWMDDVTDWLRSTHFHIIDNPTDQDKFPCYLSATGIGSLIAFTFILK
jgi:hypothetical protein